MASLNTNNTYSVKIEGLSPIYIGSGEIYSQLDYIAENNQIHIIDFEKILSQISFEIIEDLTNDIKHNFRNNIWKGNIMEFFNKYELDWRSAIIKSYDLIGNVGQNEINQFIKAGEQLYIPGSSTKGAIRTAILFKVLKDHPSEKNKILKNIKRYFNDRNIQNILQQNPKDDLLRALIIGDTKPITNEKNIKIVESTVYHLLNKDRTIPFFNEIIHKGFNSTFSVKINKKLVQSGILKEKYFQLQKTEMINAINEFSKAMISYELEQLQNSNDSNLNSIITFYKEIDEKFEKLTQDECILRIGQGSSFIGITLFLLFKDDLDMMKRYSNLAVITFDIPDRKNRNFAIARERGYTILIDRNSKFRPRLNETWLCQVASTIRKKRLKFVKLKEKMEGSMSLKNITYPMTRKLIDSGNELLYPYGWVKLTWK